MYKADFHIHTSYCKHAKGSVSDYVKAAIQLGMDEICFTDHLYRYYLPPEDRKKYWDWGMPEEDMEQYMDDVRQARQNYPEIKIGLGVEADYIEGHESELDDVLGRYSFDHVIASVHCLPQLGWKHIVDYKKTESIEMFRMFFDALTKAAGTGLFTCMGHPDFVWRYFPYPFDKQDEINEMVAGFINAVADNKNISIEANANAVLWGMDKTDREKELFGNLMLMAAEKKVPVTLGSDAHRPLQIAAFFGEMISVMKRVNIKKTAVFRKRKMNMINIT